jgi:hypothetical protein
MMLNRLPITSEPPQPHFHSCINNVLCYSRNLEVSYPAARYSRTVAAHSRARRRPAHTGHDPGRNRAHPTSRSKKRAPLETSHTLRRQGRPQSTPSQRKAAQTLPRPAPATGRTTIHRSIYSRIPHRYLDLFPRSRAHRTYLRHPLSRRSHRPPPALHELDRRIICFTSLSNHKCSVPHPSERSVVESKNLLFVIRLRKGGKPQHYSSSQLPLP